MKSDYLKLFTLIMIMTLIMTGYLIMYEQPTMNSEDEAQKVVDNEVYLAPGPLTSRGTRAGTSWPFYRGDLPHTGFDTSSVPSDNMILWSNTTGNGDGYGSPVAEEGKVFIGSADGYLYCFDLNNGMRLWRTLISSADFGICGTPGVFDDHVYVFCSGDDALHSLWTSNGTVDWSYDPGGGAYGGSSPAITSENVYFGSGNRYLYCLNRTTGTMIWSYQTDSASIRNYGIQSSPAVANGRVFVGACDG